MTRVKTIRDVTVFLAMLMIAWLLAMALLVYGEERREDNLPSKAPNAYQASET